MCQAEREYTDWPTSDAEHPQDCLNGVTEVVSLEDYPDVLQHLRVHSLGHPEAIATVSIDQFARIAAADT